MKLETERLIVLPCTEDVMQMLTEQNYNNGPQVQDYLKQLEEDADTLYWGPWIAILKSDGTIIGDMGFKGKPDENESVEVGYGLLEEYWNKGYATEAVGALIDWAWHQSGVRKIRAETLVDNQGSIRVLEKLGMKEVIRSEELIYWEIAKL